MNKKLLPGIISVFKSACVIFTLVVFSFYIAGTALSNEAQALTLSKMALVFLFSFWFAACNLLFKLEIMNIILRIALHFVSSTVGFYCIFLLIPGYAKNQSSAFAATVVFIIAYTIVSLIVFLVKRLFKKETEKEEDYKSIYNKNKKDDRN